MLHISKMYQLGHVHISDKYDSTYASYKLNAINNVTTSIGIHTFQVISKYPWTNIPIISHIQPRCATIHDIEGIVNVTILFVRLRSLKKGGTYMLSSCHVIDGGVNVTLCQQCCQWLHSICNVRMIKNEMQHDCWSCNAIGTSIWIM